MMLRGLRASLVCVVLLPGILSAGVSLPFFGGSLFAAVGDFGGSVDPATRESQRNRPWDTGFSRDDNSAPSRLPSDYFGKSRPDDTNDEESPGKAAAMTDNGGSHGGLFIGGIVVLILVGAALTWAGVAYARSAPSQPPGWPLRRR